MYMMGYLSLSYCFSCFNSGDHTIFFFDHYNFGTGLDSLAGQSWPKGMIKTHRY